MKANSKSKISRRSLLKSGVAASTAAAAGTLGAPMIWAQSNIVLRQSGTGVSAFNEIAAKAKEDLGITMEMTALDSDSVVQKVATQPKSFDIADIEYWMCKKLWPIGNLQAMDTSKIANYDKIVGIFKNGKLTPTSTADTLGIRPDLINRPINTWAELLNPEFKGKASILDISSIGIMDMAMVCEAMGEIQYGDKGNMTKEEIDKTIGIFTEAKKAGQFRAFWKSFDESVNLMASGEVVIQSMWSPAITAVRSKGIPCVYQPLKEGYRSWGGGLGIAAHLSGKELDAAYEYINWYLSGWVGGFLMRQGYYSAAVETSKEYMSADEWGFWFEGKESQGDIVNPQGVKMESAGAVRDGGSFYDRMGSVACWNAVMDENQYMVRKWNEFIAS